MAKAVHLTKNTYLKKKKKKTKFANINGVKWVTNRYVNGKAIQLVKK